MVVTRCDLQVAGSIMADLCWLFRRPVEYEREGIPAFDGSTLHLDWYRSAAVHLFPRHLTFGCPFLL